MGRKEAIKTILIKILIFGSIAIMAVDEVYRWTNNISYAQREKCVLYRSIPRNWFLFFESFIELMIVIIVGIFVANLLGKFFLRYKRFYPKTSIGAFLYGSLLPICSCGAIPIVGSLKGKMKMRVLITFLLATPLLSPPIILLSFTVLGYKYAILRIVGSLILALGAGVVIEYFSGKVSSEDMNLLALNASDCDEKINCRSVQSDIYGRTWDLFVSLLPYLILAGSVSFVFGMFVPNNFLLHHPIPNNLLGMIAITLAGIPLYFCGGAEIIILRPLIDSFGLSLGSALAFSFTGPAICIAAIVMLSKFLGKRLTAILVAYIFVASLLLGLAVNFMEANNFSSLLNFFQ